MITIRSFRWGNKNDAVLHAPHVVGGNSTTLSKYLNMIGCPSICVAYEQHPFDYQADVILWRENMSLFRKEVLRVLSVFRATLGYQIIHFNFGTTMTNPSLPVPRTSTTRINFVLRRLHSIYSEGLQIIELFLLRIFRRKVFVTFQGDDARQGDLSKILFEESIAHHTGDTYYSRVTDRAKRRRIKRICKVASHVSYVNPDLANFLPSSSRFVPYCHTDVYVPSRQSDPVHNRSIRFLHAPSHRGAKGTDLIIEVFRNLRSSGLSVELVLIEGLPQTKVWEAIHQCDVLVDQLYAGWYGGVAVEALCRGVTVMTNIRHDDLKVVEREMVLEMPIIPVTAQTLGEAVSKYLDLGDQQIETLSKKCIAYAQRWHSPEMIARHFSTLYIDRA